MTAFDELDEIDLRMIDALQEDPDLTQTELAKKLSLSQPSIGNRIKKLIEMGFISKRIGVDLKKAGLFILEASMNARNTVDTINLFRGCPYFSGAITESGHINLRMIFATDDLATVEAILENKLKGEDGISDLTISVITSSTFPIIHRLKLTIPKGSEPQCEKQCSCVGCSLQSTDRCRGCPYMNDYRGPFWKKV